MIRSQLVKRLLNKNPHLIQKDVEKVTSLVLDKITSTLENDGRVEIRGFGSFFTKAREKRIGMNPQNGKNIEIEKKVHPKFKMGKILFKKLNPK